MVNLIKIFIPEIIKVIVFLILFSLLFVYSELNRNGKSIFEYTIKKNKTKEILK